MPEDNQRVTWYEGVGMYVDYPSPEKCPVRGASVLTGLIRLRKNGSAYQVVCASCQASGPLRLRICDAIDDWNEMK